MGEGAKYVKRLLYIPPDEHPHRVWTVRHVVVFSQPVEIYVYNDTRSPHRLYGDRVVLTSGVYEVYYNGRRVAVMNLISETPQTANVNLQGAPPPAMTVRVTTAKTVTTSVTVIEKTTIPEKATITQPTVITSTIYLTILPPPQLQICKQSP